MTYEEREKQLCRECSMKETCPYIPRKMEYKCQHLLNMIYGWELGHKDAIEKASQYVYHLCAHPRVIGIDGEELVEHFKKYMEEQQ